MMCSPGSDSNSEKSLGSIGNDSVTSRNTLLAMDTRGAHMKRAMNKIHDDMRIDSSLFDPDSLWRRPNAGYVVSGCLNNVNCTTHQGMLQNRICQMDGSGSVLQVRVKSSDFFWCDTCGYASHKLEQPKNIPGGDPLLVGGLRPGPLPPAKFGPGVHSV